MLVLAFVAYDRRRFTFGSVTDRSALGSCSSSYAGGPILFPMVYTAARNLNGAVPDRGQFLPLMFLLLLPAVMESAGPATLAPLQ